MSEKGRRGDDDELQEEIYATIRRLERLAKRLEIYAEEQDGDHTEEAG